MTQRNYDVDPESAQVREVYAHFGLAVYLCQAFERRFATALASVYGPGPTKITKNQYDELLSDLFNKTLGNLVRRFHKSNNVTPERAQELTDALTTRNKLVHHYFWDRAVTFMTEGGRNSMIEELQEIQKQFTSITSKIGSDIDDWVKDKGLSRKQVEAEMARLLSENN